MVKRFLFVVVIFFASLACAQVELETCLVNSGELAAAAKWSPAEYDNTDLVLLDDISRVRYETDGSYRYVSDMAVKIITEKGREQKSTLRTWYDAAYGISRFVRAEIYKADGRVIPIDIDALSRTAIDQGQMNSNIYDPNSKVVRLTVPDLELGDVLRYTVSGEWEKTIVPGTWSDFITLEDEFPIRHTLFEVDAPAALPLQRIELRDEIPGTVRFSKNESDGRILYRWEAGSIPRMFTEPDMPAKHTVVQRLLVSTIPDWETLSKWYWALSEPRLNETNAAMVAKVEELTAGLSDPQKKVESIFRFVSQDIRYMGITVEDEAPGYEPHDVCMTFDNRYGVCRDKAALLVTMLRIAGFDARPVLIYVGPKKDPDVPQPWFNHAITAIRNADGSWMLMDATNENTRDILPAYLSNRSYLVATPDGDTLRTSPVVPPEENMLSIDMSASLDADGRMIGKAVLNFEGINDTAYRGRFAVLKPEEREPYFEKRLKDALGNARLLELDIQPEEVRNTTQPLSATLRFEVKDAFAGNQEDAVLQVPTLINRFGLFGSLIGGGIGLDKRRYPLQTDITCGIHETVRLDLNGSGLRPAALPDYETVDTPNLYISRSAAVSNNIINATADILLRTVEFSPEEYLTLKENLKTSERNARRRVILESTGIPADADRVILSEDVVYTFYNDTSWKEERTVRQKVLTYAGKREAADLKIAYNSALQEVKLISATVTAMDGSVREIDPDKEVNIMDAGWVADAPRYPAEKILVANLPNVEVGSTIETKVAVLNHGQPFFSTTEVFGGLNPILSKTVKIISDPSVRFQVGNDHPQLITQKIAHRDFGAVHSWSSTHCQTVRKEENLPPIWAAVPSVFVSTGNTDVYAEQLQKALRDATGGKAVKKKAKELTKELSTDSEKITAIRDFVDRAVRLAGPGVPALPVTAVTPAATTLAEGYGNSADRAILLYSLLDYAGFQPRFVLSSSLPQKASVNTEIIGNLQRAPFDSVLVAVQDENNNPIYLGDTGRYAALGTVAHRGRPSIDLSEKKIIHLPSPIPEAMATSFKLELSESGDVSMTRETALQGIEFEKFHRQFAQFTPEEQKREYQSLLSRISQSARPESSLKTSFGNPGRIEFSATIPGYAIQDEDFLYFTLPEDFGNLLGLDSTDRKNPFFMDQSFERLIGYEITLPDGWEVALSPEPFRLALPDNGGSVELNRAVLQPNRLIIVLRANINPAMVPTGQYDQLLKIQEQLTRPAASTVLLQKK